MFEILLLFWFWNSSVVLQVSRAQRSCALFLLGLIHSALVFLSRVHVPSDTLIINLPSSQMSEAKPPPVDVFVVIPGDRSMSSQIMGFLILLLFFFSVVIVLSG